MEAIRVPATPALEPCDEQSASYRRSSLIAHRSQSWMSIHKLRANAPASDASAFVTGTVVTVDGGYLCA